MNKLQVIDAVIHRMAGGNVTPDIMGKYHPEMVAKYITEAMNSVLYDIYRNDEASLDLYSKEYSVSVSNDVTLDLYYSTLPAKIVELPMNAGIRLVTNKQDQTSSIDLVPANQQPVLGNLDVAIMDNKPWCHLAQNKLFYHNWDPDIENVLMKLVIPFEEYGDTDNIYLPSGKGVDIFNLVQTLFLQMPPEDFRNDNNSTQ